MSMTAMIGAFLALLPGAKTLDRVDKLDGLADQMQAERDQLARELEAQRNLVKHWMGEAKSLARRLRVDREMYDRLLQKEREQRDAFNREFIRLTDNMQAQAAMQQAKAAMQHTPTPREIEAYLRERGQHHLLNPPPQQANLQQLGQQQGQLGSLGMQNAFQGFGDFCNCVPGRHQVFEAERQRALRDPASDRIAQLRP